MRLVARLAVPVLALAVTLPAYAEAGTPSAPARADHSSKVQTADGSHDVWFIDDGFARERRRIDPGRAAGDITSIRECPWLSSVVFTLKERALPRPRKRDLLVTPIFLIKTSAPARYLALVFSVKNLQQGVAGLVSYQDGDFVDCDGITSGSAIAPARSASPCRGPASATPGGCGRRRRPCTSSRSRSSAPTSTSHPAAAC